MIKFKKLIAWEIFIKVILIMILSVLRKICFNRCINVSKIHYNSQKHLAGPQWWCHPVSVPSFTRYVPVTEGSG